MVSIFQASLEERLDRLEREERAEEGEVDGDTVLRLETKAQEPKREEKIGDALDSIRVRNAEREQASRDVLNVVAVQAVQAVQAGKEEDEQDSRDAQLARKIFEKKRPVENEAEINETSSSDTSVEHVRWKAAKKQKKAGLLPGIIRKSDGQRSSSQT